MKTQRDVAHSTGLHGSTSQNDDDAWLEKMHQRGVLINSEDGAPEFSDVAHAQIMVSSKKSENDIQNSERILKRLMEIKNKGSVCSKGNLLGTDVDACSLEESRALFATVTSLVKRRTMAQRKFREDCHLTASAANEAWKALSQTEKNERTNAASPERTAKRCALLVDSSDCVTSERDPQGCPSHKGTMKFSELNDLDPVLAEWLKNDWKSNGLLESWLMLGDLRLIMYDANLAAAEINDPTSGTNSAAGKDWHRDSPNTAVTVTSSYATQDATGGQLEFQSLDRLWGLTRLVSSGENAQGHAFSAELKKDKLGEGCLMPSGANGINKHRVKKVEKGTSFTFAVFLSMDVTPEMELEICQAYKEDTKAVPVVARGERT